MIGFLKGILEENRNGNIIIDVNGIGFEVYIGEKEAEDLPAIGNEIKIFTYMVVREDNISLCGFLKRDQLEMFELLINVSGVGPKSAVAILNTFTVMDLKYAIVSENSTVISKTPTIGKKTAEKIIVELKDKFSKEELVSSESFEAEPVKNNKFTPDMKDAVDALISLGYDRKKSENAVLKIDGCENLDSGSLLKKALLFLY